MNRNILYVDDEIDNIIVFEAAFEDDFNILTATSGEEALGILEKNQVPLVVSDQRMPEMTGVELFEIIRCRFPDSKRILLTGYTDTDAMADAINKGQVFHYVKKPWQREFLHSLLMRALETYSLEMANSTLTNRLITSEHCALLGRATAQITHEMQNQLCIPPLLELIEDKYSDDKDLMEIGHFTRETYKRLESLIQEVNNFMRFEKKTFNAHPLPLSTVVYELIPFLRYDESIPHEQIVMTLHSDSVVNANKIKLQQVLVNLIKNAVHAIRDRPDGKITVSIESHETEASITVSDNGCGMSADILGQMWEPFFTTKESEGNGIGLHVSRDLIESFGGTIECESVPNQGTTFRVRLPKCNRTDVPTEMMNEMLFTGTSEVNDTSTSLLT